ncbi:hypothetical protein [Nostoc sp. FACHB-133]|uniref:hypothetical protein n=1 Tax=Nostoc sp. FACHB-133 TaxID=2692835 RepID=UPI001F555857|nr:hypothetical protein [Nostoc sp. FACHB-133]
MLPAAGIATPIVFLVLVAVLALFPEFTVVLSAPVVIAGFNALFGISIAMPIVQGSNAVLSDPVKNKRSQK